MQRGISWQWWWALGKWRWLLWAEWLSLPRSLFLSKQVMKGRLVPAGRPLPHSWHFSAHTQTYWPVPGVGWCFQWGKGDLSDPWSRASTLQQQSPGHISAQPGDPLLQGTPTAHCPTLLKLHSVWGGVGVGVCTLHRYILSSHINTLTSFKRISQVIDLHLRTWHSKYPFMVETWLTARLLSPSRSHACKATIVQCVCH